MWHRATTALGGFALGGLALVGCTSDPTPTQPVVTAQNAYTAIVQWEVDQTEPVLDEDGEVQPPVIYVAAGSGGTVDVAVQAAVVAAIDEEATIRFTDDARDARDEGLDGQPVKDDGVIIIVDEFEVGQRTTTTNISRSRSTDDTMTWHLDITAIAADAEVTTATALEDPPG